METEERNERLFLFLSQTYNNSGAIAEGDFTTSTLFEFLYYYLHLKW